MSKVVISGNENGTGVITVASPNTNSNLTLTLPEADGTSGQFLKTDGSGNLSFGAAQAYDSNLTSFVNTFTLPTTDGTNGQVLTTNGSGTLSLADAGGGAWEVLQSGSVSSVTTVDFETGFTDTTYAFIVILLNNFYSDGSGNASFRFKQSGSYASTNYSYSVIEAGSSSVGVTNGTAQAQMVFSGAQVENTSPYSTMLLVKNRFSTVAGGPSLCTFGIQQGGGSQYANIAQGIRTTGGAIQGVRFLLSGGGGSTTLVSGNYITYGIKAA